MDKIYLLFPYRWWPEEVKSFNLLWTNDEKNDYIQNVDSVSLFYYCGICYVYLYTCYSLNSDTSTDDYTSNKKYIT